MVEVEGVQNHVLREAPAFKHSTKTNSKAAYFNPKQVDRTWRITFVVRGLDALLEHLSKLGIGYKTIEIYTMAYGM